MYRYTCANGRGSSGTLSGRFWVGKVGEGFTCAHNVSTGTPLSYMKGSPRASDEAVGMSLVDLMRLAGWPGRALGVTEVHGA